jgi:hypothetical protein
MPAFSVLGVAKAAASGIGLAPLPGILFEEPVFKTLLTPVLAGLRCSNRCSIRHQRLPR